ncbi:MAG: hypothetical protein ABJJ69_08970 [Paracoccaceae bacterium]
MVELMHSPLQFLILLMATGFGLVVFVYGLSGMMYPFYAGGWPISLFYVFLFLAALILPLKAGLNARFFKALVTAALFNFLFLYIANANIGTSRALYFDNGVPTLAGIVFQLTFCVGVLMFAIGMSAIIRDFGEHLNRYFSNADGE